MTGWRTKTLGELLLKTETVNPARLPDEEFDYIDVSSVSNETYSVETTQRLKGSDAPSRARRHVRAGDVLMATIRPTLKRIAVIPQKLDGQVCSTGYFVLRPGVEIDNRFLFYSLFTEQFMDAMESLQKGTSYPAVTDAEVLRQTLSFPSLVEQRRIVAILDEAFDGITIVRAKAERNLQNAHKLFETLLQSLLSDHGQDWTERSFEDVCEISAKLVDPRETAYVDLPHIGAGNIESKSGAVMDVKTAREEQLISGKFLFDESAVLYSKIRPYLMKVVRPTFVGLCSADIYPLVPKSSIERDYLYYLLLTPTFTDYAIKGSARAGMPKVNREHLFAYKAWIPPIQEQKRLAIKLEGLADKAKTLVAIFERKLAALEELKRSLLWQAFNGQLISAKPAVIAWQPTQQTPPLQFTANVIAIAYARHERKERDKSFGHVKAQKVLHLTESIAKIDLGRHPMKDAAGPNDFQHMRKAEDWAKAHKFFDMVKQGDRYEFKKLSAFDAHMSNAGQMLAPYLAKLERIIDLLVPMNKVQAEVFATVHAAWNNLLIDGADATDNAIVFAAREGWHVDKLKIAEQEFRRAISLIRQEGLIPDGTAKYVGGQQSLL